MSLPKHRVALIENTPLMRRGLRSFLTAQAGLAPGVEAEFPSEALELIQQDPPDLIISEALFPDNESIFEFLPALHSRIGRIPVLVYSNFNESVIASRVLQAGARGLIMKTASEKELGVAIKQVISGHVYLSPNMTERVLTTLSDPSPRIHGGGKVRDLTNRELEVLELVGAGMVSKDIARVLQISLKTVESHRSHILAKLSLGNSAELICYASQWRNLSKQRGWTNTAAPSL